MLCIFHHGALPSVRNACENFGIQWKNASQLSVPKASQEAMAITTAVTAALMNTRQCAGCDQHDRKQQPVLRLVRQKPEADACQYRPYRDQIERAADQRRGEESVLPDQRIDERHRNGEREQIAEVAADDRAHRDKKRHEADQRPSR